MTNITREQIEYCIKTNSSTEDEHRQLCALALRALDTPSKEEIEAKAYERAAQFHDKLADDIEASNAKITGFMMQYEGAKKDTSYERHRGYATAIRALSPSTIRYVELPEGHVVVSVEAQPSHIKIIEDFIGDYTDRPIHGVARLYHALIGEVK